jgi:hypothetical protein
MQQAAPLSTLQFLDWVARQNRTYGEVKQAWRTTCPRLSAWEDALDQGLIEFVSGGGRVGDRSGVALTERGRSMLEKR